MNVLIIVDCQNDFITGSLGTTEAKNIISNIIKKIKEYDNENSVIFLTKDTHDFNYLNTQEGMKLPVEHCIKETYGWNIHNDIIKAIKSLKNINEVKIIEKNTFGSTELLDEFLNADEESQNSILFDPAIEIVGLCTDICVISNALLLKTFDISNKIKIDAKCCAGVTPEKHNQALSVMESCQIEVVR